MAVLGYERDRGYSSVIRPEEQSQRPYYPGNHVGAVTPPARRSRGGSRGGKLMSGSARPWQRADSAKRVAQGGHWKMVDTQHFCLRWNNYQSSITSAFENLRDDEDFVDVTLACEGKSLKAHRVVLSACSPYFRELLKSTPCKHPVIVLQDVAFADLHALVEFIYHGEVNVHQRSLTSFLKTAEVLRVSGLTQQADYRDEGSTRNHQGFPPDKLDDSLFSPPSPLHPHPPHSHTQRRTANQRRDPDHTTPSDFDKYDHSGVPAKRLKPEDCLAVGSSGVDGEIGTGAKINRNSPIGEESIKTEPAEGSGPPGAGAVGGGDGEVGGEEDEDEDDDNSINSVEGPPLDNPMVPSGNQLSSSEDHDGGPGGGSLVPNPYYHLSMVPDGKGSLYPPPPSQQSQSSAPFRFDMTPCMSDPGNIPGLGSQNMKGLAVDGSAGTSTQDLTLEHVAVDLPASIQAVLPPHVNLHPASHQELVCHLCNKALCSRSSLRRHMEDKHVITGTEFRCIPCNRAYSSRNSLMKHRYTYHKNQAVTSLVWAAHREGQVTPWRQIVGGRSYNKQ
ncbi:broad-complex core protein isoforms 1/2/3/4/5-like isoform X4 [Ischnura elegans]|uniref:broad-complex core protein isoforms 1/2/3/4/5-like isoform X4 n=1 Tax=Ischnura elegans TaxID=197161 RepID=UPI001ED86EE6|nr:broad-complex core protein isoforms 1/2/3/4/5-like isoform X4 [Ischnura elegans]